MLGGKLSGVDLEPAKQRRFNDIQSEISQLSNTFRNHVLDSTKEVAIVLTSKAELDGLPETLRKAMAGDNDPERGPWRATVDNATYYPFLAHSKNRPVREALMRARSIRATKGEQDNTEIVKRILKLRQESEKVNILGWDVPVPGEFRLDCEIAPHGAPKEWSFVFYQMPDDPKVVSSRRYPYLKLSVAAGQCQVGFGQWSEIKDFKGGEQASFPFVGDRVKLTVAYAAGHVKVFANGLEKPLIETDDCSRMLKSIKSGRLRFNGTSVRLHSLRVSSSSVVGP